MGKGDQRTRRGKIWRGTFGKRRPKSKHAVATTTGVVTAESPPDTTVPAVETPPKKRPVRKKAEPTT